MAAAAKYARAVSDILYRRSIAENIAAATGIGNAEITWDQTALTFWTDIVDIAYRKGIFRELHDNVVAEFGLKGDHENLDTLATMVQNPGQQGGPYRSADPYRARLVGPYSQYAVFNRFDLRSYCENMTQGMPALFILGESQTGKSHSWYYVQHIANAEGHMAVLVDIEDTWGSTECTATKLMEFITDQLGITLNLTATDDVQPDTWPKLLVGRLVFKLSGLPDNGPRRWVVIDGVNRPNVTSDAIGLVEALAKAAEKGRLKNLQLIITGYNGELIANPLPGTGIEHIQPIDRPEVERFFTDVSGDYGRKVDKVFLSSLMEKLYVGLGAQPDLGRLGAKAAKLVLLVFGGQSDE
jgi:hypothetical protein